MANPPVKCLRGVVTIPNAAANALGTNVNVPIAIFFYNSPIGHKVELSYQQTNGAWVEISKASTTPGIYEGPVYFGTAELQAQCNNINQMGVKMWGIQQLQQWANDNLYAFFKPLMSAQPTPGGPATPANFLDVVNGGLDDEFVFVDTNGDGIPEFHGK